MSSFIFPIQCCVCCDTVRNLIKHQYNFRVEYDDDEDMELFLFQEVGDTRESGQPPPPPTPPYYGSSEETESPPQYFQGYTI